MKIALVHSYYSSRVPSGENLAVDAQAAVLRQAGHEVEVVAQSTDDRLTRRGYPIEAALTAMTGRGPSPLEDLRAFGPDLVHVHNLFPNFGRTWLRRWDGPLVATLHNYRPLCPGSTLFRDGAVCVECPSSGSVRPAVRHGCFHESRPATLPVALGTKFARDPVLERADVLATLSSGMSRLYTDAGVPAHKLRVLENFVAEPPRPGPGGDYWLYAGRIEPEKGLPALLARWPQGQRLLVAGEPPVGLLPAHPDVELLGRLSRERLREVMAGARGLVFPSIWPEALALVCLEALAVGTPIVTFDDIPAGVAVAELGIGVAGPRADVAGLLTRAHAELPGLREHCVTVFGERFTPQAWLRRAEDLYRDAIDRSLARAHR